MVSRDIRYGIALRNKLGTLRQVHLLSSKSKLVSAVSQFVQIFNDNILNTIETNFNNTVSEEDFLGVLDMIEEISKKKREAISSYISATSGSSINSWNLFNVLCKFSTMEKHINTRVLIENIAEKVLILPIEFYQMMQKIAGR
jgi:AAA+ ATPase superfamily predicted ATPase